jgi:hypothetical protein
MDGMLKMQEQFSAGPWMDGMLKMQEQFSARPGMGGMPGIAGAISSKARDGRPGGRRSSPICSASHGTVSRVLLKRHLLVQESSQFLLSRQGFEPCL